MGQPGGNWTQAPSSVNIPFWGEKTHLHTEKVFGMTHFVDWMWCVLSRIIIPDPASTIMKPAVKPSTRYCWFTFKDNLYTRIHSSDTGKYFKKYIWTFTFKFQNEDDLSQILSMQYVIGKRRQSWLSATQLWETVQISSESIHGYHLPLHDRHRAAIAILIQLHPEGWGRVDDVVSQTGDREVVDDKGDLRIN